jgi:hypothetical protein
MKNLFAIILMMTLTTSGSMSWGGGEITHPNQLNGMPLIQRASCTDRESGLQGMCFVIQGPDSIYMAFHLPGEGALFLRRLLPEGGYETVWHRDANGAVPSGIPL